ncbi:urate oxidase [Brachybacterium muris]|uniref:factor-independent urate hydroxylase n=1 Tax=Brachybacterium muris TaxID=219301 RepID=UPI00195EBBFF|nr:urate oxidase [Brachybacterium muris]MBM7500268.1 urate oxidase [Brachybacterium muris]
MLETTTPQTPAGQTPAPSAAPAASVPAGSAPTAVLGRNQYGKAEVRLVHVDRSTPRHVLTDLNVTSMLRGDFEDCYRTGDNARVIATDTQKNTVYAFAKQYGVAGPERFLLRLAEHFMAEGTWLTGGRWEAEQLGWERIIAAGEGHDHSFVRTGPEVRTAAVTVQDGAAHVIGGIKDLVVLKSTGSEFHGFPRDRYTTLPETTDRILATEVTARWRFREPITADGTSGVDPDETFAAVRAVLLETFATTHSLSLQQTLFAIGEAVLAARPELAEIRMVMPNKHHYLVDLSPFELGNDNEVFIAGDRPYGLMQAAVTRPGEPDQPAAWEWLGGFC